MSQYTDLGLAKSLAPGNWSWCRERFVGLIKDRLVGLNACVIVLKRPKRLRALAFWM